MARFTCEICGAEFEQRSRYERHRMTSHPQPAPSAADLEAALKGVDFPASREELVALAEGRGRDAIADLIGALPDRRYRDAAEVARAFGERRSHRQKPSHQPSKRGGERAMSSLSAARIASLFAGMQFPASGADLKAHARERANEEEMQIVERFDDRRYHSMADVGREIGKVATGR